MTSTTVFVDVNFKIMFTFECKSYYEIKWLPTFSDFDILKKLNCLEKGGNDVQNG